MYLSIGEVSNLIGVSPSSLRRWEKEKVLVSDFRTKGNHRRYKYRDILHFLGEAVPKQKTAVIYARVSSCRQKDDLARQIEVLKDYARENDMEITAIYSDIASGLNDQRQSMLRLIADLPKIQPDFLLCTYRDRMARFGTQIIEQVCRIYGCELLELHQKTLDEQEELVDGIIAILYSYAGKLYRSRRGKNSSSAG